MINNIKNKFENWRNYNRAVRELNSLTDSQLRDIGIARVDIRWVAGQTR